MALLVLILWPVLEVVAAIAVAHAIGVLAMILLLVAGWPVGSWLMRAEGRSARTRLRGALAAGRAPGDEAADVALGLLAGPLLIIPGFISDALAVLLVLPPLRHRLAGFILRHARARWVGAAAGFGRGPRRWDVDAAAWETAPETGAEPPRLGR